jgi:hypothetical protein
MFNIENLDQTYLSSVHNEIVRSDILKLLKNQNKNEKYSFLFSNDKDFYTIFHVYFLFKISNYVELEYSNFDDEDRASLEFFSRETAPLELISTVHENTTNINFLLSDIEMFLNLHSSLITDEKLTINDLFVTFLNKFDKLTTLNKNYSTKDLIHSFMTYNTDMEMYMYNINLLQELYDENENKNVTAYIVKDYLKQIKSSENDSVESLKEEEKEDLDSQLEKILEDFSSNSYEPNKHLLEEQINNVKLIDNNVVHKEETNDLKQDVNEYTSVEVKTTDVKHNNMVSSKINEEVLKKVNTLLENSNYNKLYLALSTYMNEVLNG